MSYTCQYLQFGSNDVRVPGYEDDLILVNKPYAPIPKKLVNPNNSDLWDLIFSYESGGFFKSTSKVPGIDGATIQSWYSKEGEGTGPHTLAFTPFIIEESGGGGGFAQATHFVDFSQATPNDNWINTDTISGSNVTATVHQELPEYAKLSIGTHATSHSVIITTTSTKAVFDKIFVYAGNANPIGHSITVAKATSCQALAIFKKVSTSSSKEIGTLQYPKIPKYEWPMLISEIVREIMLNQKGEIYEHLSSRVLASLDRETLKSAVAAITQHVEHLDKVKTVITGLTGKAGK